MTTNTLQREAEIVICADENDPATRCVGCNKGFTDKQMESISTVMSMGATWRCKCGESYINRFEFNIQVRSDNAHLLSDSTAQEATWFHVTGNRYWFDEVQAGGNTDNRYRSVTHRKTGNAGDVMVHVGTEATALARMQQLKQMQMFDLDDELGIEPEFFMFEVKLASGAALAEDIEQDVLNFPGFSGEILEDECWVADGGTRYVNAYETPGSVSMLVNAKALEMVYVTEV